MVSIQARGINGNTRFHSQAEKTLLNSGREIQIRYGRDFVVVILTVTVNLPKYQKRADRITLSRDYFQRFLKTIPTSRLTA